jgi:hypothetical protein
MADLSSYISKQHRSSPFNIEEFSRKLLIPEDIKFGEERRKEKRK